MEPSISQQSGYRFYSFGVVTEDKTDDGDYIKVTPIEELPLVKGKLSEATFDYESKGTDHKGVTTNTSTKGVAFLVARWAPMECGNRNTAPNVYEGETVMLIKYGSSNDIFWTDIFRETKLRRLENVVYAFSNLSSKGEAYDQESSYWFQVSTRDKIVKLHTSNNDGEACGYDINIDTSAGTFELIDTSKNRIFLDSVNGDLKMDINNSVEINTLKVRSNGKEYVRTTGDEIKDTAGSKIEYRSSGTFDEYSGGTVDIHNPTNITGNTNIAGNLAVTGVITAPTVTASVNVTGGGISLKDHKHKYNPGPGGPVDSQPPTP